MYILSRYVSLICFIQTTLRLNKKKYSIETVIGFNNFP